MDAGDVGRVGGAVRGASVDDGCEVTVVLRCIFVVSALGGSGSCDWKFDGVCSNVLARHRKHSPVPK